MRMENRIPNSKYLVVSRKTIYPVQNTRSLARRSMVVGLTARPPIMIYSGPPHGRKSSRERTGRRAGK